MDDELDVLFNADVENEIILEEEFIDEEESGNGELAASEEENSYYNMSGSIEQLYLGDHAPDVQSEQTKNSLAICFAIVIVLLVIIIICCLNYLKNIKSKKK